MREIRERALDARGARLVVIAERRAPQAQLRLETVEPPLPALGAADHGTLDEQLLPPPRRAHGAGDDALVRRIERQWIVHRGFRGGGQRVGDHGRHEIVLRRRPHRVRRVSVE